MRTVRVLAILTARQLIDNWAYLVSAVIFSLVFVPAIVIVVLTEEFTAPSFHAVAVFVSLPVLACLGACTLGILQTRADRASGVSELLSVLAVGRYQVFCARIIIGIVVIFLALAPLMLTGTILWRIVRPPAWLVRDWRADVFSGMFLAAFTSYALGLSAGTKARTSFRAFAVAPLPILLVLLIVMKGFGWPLASVLLAILIALPVASIGSHPAPGVAVSALGLLALVFLSIAFFWGHFLNDAALARRGYDAIDIYASSLLAEKESASDSPSSLEVRVQWVDWRWQIDPLYNNLYRRPGVLSDLCLPFQGSEDVLRHLGIAEYVRSRKQGNYYANDTGRDGYEFAHLGYVDGRLVYHRNDAHSQGPVFPWDWERATVQYVGPQGISEVPAGGIGRFCTPLVGASEFVENRGLWSMGPSRYDLNTFTLFETQSRRFFYVDLERQIVSRGPELGFQTDKPVQVGTPCRRDICRIDVHLPQDAAEGPEVGGSARSPYVPVICESGLIELLDRKTLQIVGEAGALPCPPTPFGRGSRRPRDLLASDVVLLAVDAPRRDSETDRIEGSEYIGAVAASVSRQGRSLSIAVFDKQGKTIETRNQEWSLPPEHLVMKSIFESPHPPILTLASFFAAYSFEAGATHRALFLMPNSLVAQQRDRQRGFVVQLLAALLYLLPALAFAGFLSWRVVRDAAVIGLSRRARWLWGLGTVAFGLPAYITYRLTRSRVALALCQECGRNRRVDRETCHHCGSGWKRPALNPPVWRVVSP